MKKENWIMVLSIVIAGLIVWGFETFAGDKVEEMVKGDNFEEDED